MIISGGPNVWSQLLVDTTGLHQVQGLEFKAPVLRLQRGQTIPRVLNGGCILLKQKSASCSFGVSRN
jgi:hypothetical protein